MSNRRERVRQAALNEIRQIACRLLVEQGPAAVTINAIAREMGMSGPAMYRYYSSHEQLVAALVTNFYQELTNIMEQARADHTDKPVEKRILILCRVMRAWAIENPAKFRWLFASPSLAANERHSTTDVQQAGQGFGRVFLEQMVILWQESGFPTSDVTTMDPSLKEQLRVYCAELDNILPPQAMHVFLWCWTQLYGLLCMENLKQLSFAYTNTGPVFEQCLADICAKLSIPYTLPEDL